MFLPIGDEPNPGGRSYINWALIAANVVVFAVVSLPLMGQPADPNNPLFTEYLEFLSRNTRGVSIRELARHVSAYDLFVFQHGFRPSRFDGVTLFSSMFLHGGWAHLIGNMLFLWIYGDNVESRLGRIPYLLVYLVTGAAATLFFSLFAWGSDVPLVGASGAISGVLGCYFLWFPDNRVKVLVVLLFMVDVWRIPARWVLGFYLFVDNVLPFLIAPKGGGGVAHGAHIGGFIGGLAVAWWLRGWAAKQGRVSELGGRGVGPSAQDEIFFTPVGSRSSGERLVAGVNGFRQAVALGDWNTALRIYADLSPRERLQIEDSDTMRLADWLTDKGNYDTALAILQQYLSTHQHDSRGLARAHLRAGLIHLHFKRQPQAAAEHLYQVLELEPTQEMQHVARNALAEVERLRHSGPRLN